MEDLESRINNSKEIRRDGFLARVSRNKWLRRTVLPLATATSMFFGSERILHSATPQQSSTLTHDPILLIHGLGIGSDGIKEYADFDGNRIVDFEDFFQFSDRYGKKKGDPRYDPGFDLNRDENIDLEDFFIFSIYFNEIIRPSEFPVSTILESTWDDLSKALSKDLGWTDGGTVGEWVSSINLKSADFYKIRLSSGNNLTFTKQGEEVGNAVEKIRGKTKKENIILVGFSMGGLAARYYLENYPNPKASALVTICTPHTGSYLAFLPEDRSVISAWASRYKNIPWTAKEAELLLNLAISALSRNKPIIKDLAPCSDALNELNNNIYKMPINIPYVNVVSQLPNPEILEELKFVNEYFIKYKRCGQDTVATPGLLAKGDGVVPTLSQLLSHAITNTNSQNISWYEKVKSNITENAEMQVFHTEGNKQTAILKKVLEDIIQPPKSSKIAFVSVRDGNFEIYVMNTDGSSPKRLTNNPYNDESPSWSPDESKIAFMSNRDDNHEIYVMNSDGSNQINLTNNPAWEDAPSWSPDGNRIAFESKRDGNFEIYVMNTDGSSPKRLTNNPGEDRSPSWSPSGDKITFGSIRDNSWEIYIMNSDGDNQINLTNTRNGNLSPSWSHPTPTPPPNLAPYKASNPSPTNGATGISLETLLDWEGGDPDARDTVKYTIYFEKDDATPDSVLKSNLSESETKVSNLENNVTYYWQVIASDGKLSTAGDVWNFKTIDKPAGTNMILFRAEELKKDGMYGVFLINPDGTAIRELPEKNITPIKWSYDRRSILVERYINTKDIYEISILDLNNGNIAALTSNPARSEPGWSHNGKQVVFRKGGDIWTVDSNGNNETNLTNSKGITEIYPRWSPNGTKILYAVRISDPEWEIQTHTMNVDGSEKKRLMNSSYGADWSHDGRKIAFISSDKGDLYVIDSTGENIKRLTTNLSGSGANWSPLWSPNGKKMLLSKTGYDSNNKYFEELYIINPDGSNLEKISSAQGYYAGVDWSPDGNNIVYSATTGFFMNEGHNYQNFDIYVIDINTKQIKALSNTKDIREMGPVWSSKPWLNPQ